MDAEQLFLFVPIPAKAKKLGLLSIYKFSLMQIQYSTVVYTQFPSSTQAFTVTVYPPAYRSFSQLIQAKHQSITIKVYLSDDQPLNSSFFLLGKRLILHHSVSTPSICFLLKCISVFHTFYNSNFYYKSLKVLTHSTVGWDGTWEGGCQ